MDCRDYYLAMLKKFDALYAKPDCPLCHGTGEQIMYNVFETSLQPIEVAIGKMECECLREKTFEVDFLYWLPNTRKQTWLESGGIDLIPF